MWLFAFQFALNPFQKAGMLLPEMRKYADSLGSFYHFVGLYIHVRTRKIP